MGWDRGRRRAGNAGTPGGDPSKKKKKGKGEREKKKSRSDLACKKIVRPEKVVAQRWKRKKKGVHPGLSKA